MFGQHQIIVFLPKIPSRQQWARVWMKEGGPWQSYGVPACPELPAGCHWHGPGNCCPLSLQLQNPSFHSSFQLCNKKGLWTSLEESLKCYPNLIFINCNLSDTSGIYAWCGKCSYYCFTFFHSVALYIWKCSLANNGEESSTKQMEKEVFLLNFTGLWLFSFTILTDRSIWLNWNNLLFSDLQQLVKDSSPALVLNKMLVTHPSHTKHLQWSNVHDWKRLELLP